MQAELSLLSLIASGLYAVVALACTGAFFVARAERQSSWHTKTWLLTAALFVVLIISRLLGIEEVLRADLRDWLQAEDLVENRRAIQGPIIAVAIATFAAVGMIALYWGAKRISGRRNIAVAAVWGACAAMVATIAMRTVSLHALDRLLYGPLKLNWVGDMGASLVVLGAATYYIGIVSGRIGARR